MPIEVRELVIKATVVQESGTSQEKDQSSSNNAVSSSEEIINICVEKIIGIIKDRYER